MSVNMCSYVHFVSKSHMEPSQEANASTGSKQFELVEEPFLFHRELYQIYHSL